MERKKRQVKVSSYSKMIVPKDYKCDDCGKCGVRLWREYQVASSKTRLLCAHCAKVDQRREHRIGWKSSFSERGGDRIGIFIPAVPEENSNTYWGYFVIPNDGLKWWKNLPLEK